MGDTWIGYGELREIVGDEAARKLCAVHGGVSFYVPRTSGENSRLRQIIGIHALASLSRYYGGEMITVPNRRHDPPRKSRILQMLDDGKSAREIALALGVTQRYVEMLSKVCRPKSRQTILPGLGGCF